MTPVWTELKTKQLLAFYEQYHNENPPVREIAKILNVSVSSVKHKAWMLGVGEPPRPKNGSVRSRSGTREGIGPNGENLYVRSRWESNFCRYLNWLQVHGEILRWEYEPHTFWFPVKRGNRSYTPDFRVWKNETEYEWHEVKGWMDDDSRVKLKRFAKFYPDETLVLIDKERYSDIAKSVSALIPGWEK